MPPFLGFPEKCEGYDAFDGVPLFSLQRIFRWPHFTASFVMGSRMMRFWPSSLMMKKSVFRSPSFCLSFFGITTTLLESVRYALAVVIIFSVILKPLL
jgi:hypothetical protein